MIQLGCFGMPSTFNPQCDSCRGCAYAQLCGKTAQAILVSLRDAKRTRVTDRLMVPHLPKVEDPSLEHRVNAAPRKVQPRLRRLIESGADRLLLADLAAGRNPFPAAKSKLLHIMGKWLLEGGFDRTRARSYCEVTLGWSYAAAASQVSNELALLRALGLTEETEQGRVVLHRQLSKDPMTA